MRRRDHLRQFLVLALLVCLNAGRPALRLHVADAAARGVHAPAGTAVVAASPAKSLSGGDAARVQWIRDAAKTPGQSAFASHQAVSLRTVPGVGTATANLQADEAAELRHSTLHRHGRAPPSLSLL